MYREVPALESAQISARSIHGAKYGISVGVYDFISTVEFLDSCAASTAANTAEQCLKVTLSNNAGKPCRIR